MVIPGPRRVSCTLCGTRFTMVLSAMVNPADVLCDACILDLWGSQETDDALRARCEARVPRDLGMSADMVADAILQRVVELRAIAHTRGEVEQLLAQRAGSGR